MINIEKAEPSDACGIARLEREYIDCPWTELQIAEEISNPDSLFYCARSDGEFAGYVSGRVCGDELELSNIAVDPKFRLNGVGTALMRELLIGARERNVRSVFLLVRDGNASAIALYKKSGFVSVGKRKKYYSEKGDAIIMKTELFKE